MKQELTGDLVERLHTRAKRIASGTGTDILLFDAADEISRLRDLNAELVEALEACPLPSTMGNVKTHYGQFYDWYKKHVEKHTPFPRKR